MRRRSSLSSISTNNSSVTFLGNYTRKREKALSATKAGLIGSNSAQANPSNLLANIYTQAHSEEEEPALCNELLFQSIDTAIQERSRNAYLDSRNRKNTTNSSISTLSDQSASRTLSDTNGIDFTVNEGRNSIFRDAAATKVMQDMKNCWDTLESLPTVNFGVIRISFIPGVRFKRKQHRILRLTPQNFQLLRATSTYNTLLIPSLSGLMTQEEETNLQKDADYVPTLQTKSPATSRISDAVHNSSRTPDQSPPNPGLASSFSSASLTTEAVVLEYHEYTNILAAFLVDPTHFKIRIRRQSHRKNLARAAASHLASPEEPSTLSTSDQHFNNPPKRLSASRTFFGSPEAQKEEKSEPAGTSSSLLKWLRESKRRGSGLIDINLTSNVSSIEELVFSSPEASRIVDSILERVRIVQGLEKQKTALKLVEKFRQNISQSSTRIIPLVIQAPENATKTDTEKQERIPKAVGRTKLDLLTGTSEDQRVSIVVEKYLYDPQKPEGSTREHFIEKGFIEVAESENGPAKALAELRRIIRGLSDYILDHHSDELYNVMTQGFFFFIFFLYI